MKDKNKIIDFRMKQNEERKYISKKMKKDTKIKSPFLTKKEK